MAVPANIATPLPMAKKTGSPLPGQLFSGRHKGLEDQDFQGLLVSLQANPFAPARSNNITLGGFHGIELKDSAAPASDISKLLKTAISRLVSAAANGVNLQSTDLKFGKTGKLSMKMLPGQKHLELQIHSGKNIASTLMSPGFLKFLDESGLESVTVKIDALVKMTLSIKSSKIAGLDESTALAKIRDMIAAFSQNAGPATDAGMYISNQTLGDILVLKRAGRATAEISTSNPETQAQLAKLLQDAPGELNTTFKFGDLDFLTQPEALNFDRVEKENSPKTSETNPLIFGRIDAGAERKHLHTTSEQQNKIAELLKEKGFSAQQFTIKRSAFSNGQNRLHLQNPEHSQQRHLMNINTKIDKMVGSILAKAVSDPVARNHLKAIRSSLQELAGQLKMSLPTGNTSDITVQAKDANVAEWLRKQIQPVLKQVNHYLENQGVKPVRVVKKSGSHGFTPHEESSGGMLSSQQNRSVLQSQNHGDSFHSGMGEKELKDILVQMQNNLPSSMALQASKFTGTPQVNSTQMLETIQKIADMVQSQSAFTGRRLGVQMDVQNLGKVDVDALKQAHKIDLQVQVDTHEAKRLVEAHLKPLVEQMVQRGIEIGKLDVSVRDNRSENQNQQSQTQNPLNWQGFSEDRHGNEATQRMQDLLTSQLIHRNSGSQTVEIWA